MSAELLDNRTTGAQKEIRTSPRLGRTQRFFLPQPTKPHHWDRDKKAAALLVPELIKHPIVQEAFAHLDQLPAHRVYHCKDHTTKDVLPGAIFMGIRMGMNRKELQALACAAAWHDTTFSSKIAPDTTKESLEDCAAKLCKEAMLRFNASTSDTTQCFSELVIDQCVTAIENTRIRFRLNARRTFDEPPCQGRTMNNRFSEALCIADLGNMGRVDFISCFRKVFFENALVKNPHVTSYDQLQLRQLSGDLFFAQAIMDQYFWYNAQNSDLLAFNVRFPHNKAFLARVSNELSIAMNDREIVGRCGTTLEGAQVIRVDDLLTAINENQLDRRFESLKRVLTMPTKSEWIPRFN